MAVTVKPLTSGLEYKEDGLKFSVHNDMENQKVTLKTEDGVAVFEGYSKHDLTSFLAIITKLKTDTDALFT